FLPRIDFLPYKVGNDIRKQMELPPNAVKDSIQMVFIYEKDGKQVELTMDQIGMADSTYKFIDRKDKVIRKGDEPAIHDFKVYDEQGVEYTDSILAGNDYHLVLVQKSIEDSRTGIEPQIAHLAQEWQVKGHLFRALSASSPDKLEPYRHEYQFSFPY